MQPNNPNQFTEKAWEAISRTPDIAKTSQNQQTVSRRPACLPQSAPSEIMQSLQNIGSRHDQSPGQVRSWSP